MVEMKGLTKARLPVLGAGGPEFKSRRPDQNISRVLFSLLKAPFTSNPICGILADRRSGFASRLLSESSPHDEFCKNMRRQECYTESIERREVKRALFGKYGGKFRGPYAFLVSLIIGNANQ